MATRGGGAGVGNRGLVGILFVGLIVGLLSLGAAAVPAVSDIALADADPTNAGTVDFTVTFDESVTGVDTTDFVVDASGITGASIDAVSGGGTTWSVSVGTGTGNGTLSIDLTDDDSIEDGLGNRLGGTGAGNGDFTAGAAYTVDKTPPSVPGGLDPADGAYVDTRSPTLSWVPSTDTGGSGLRTKNRYRYDVNGPDPKTGYSNDEDYNPTFSSDGVYTWRLYARDNAGNPSDYTDWHTFTVDTDPPGVTSFERRTPATSPTNADRLVFRVTFDEGVQNVGTDDFTVHSTSTATVTNVGQVSPTTYDVTVSGGDLAGFNGTVGLDLAGGQDVADLAGNALPAGEPPTDETYTVDNDPPGATGVTENLSVLADANAGNQTFTLTIGFDEAMDTGAAPAVAFPTIGEDPSSTIALDPTSGWTNDTTYVARYDVVDANEEIEDIDVRVTGARDAAGNAQAQYDGADVFSIDTLNPTITWKQGFPAAVQDTDTDCSLTFPIEILVSDNCCIDAADVTVTVSDPPDATVAQTLAKTQEGGNAVRIKGDVTVSALTDGGATVTIDVAATDCHGNGSSTSDAVTVVDDTLPTVSGFAVTPDDGRVDGNCEEVVTVAAVVRDGCCIDAGSVIVTPTATNASLKGNNITVTQTAQNEATVSGTIVVHSLTGCPAMVEVEIDATDCAGNRNVWTQSAEIEDGIVPVIRDLRVDEHVVVDACCEAIVTFDGYVEDNCCVHPDGIANEVTHPTNNGTVTFDPATDVMFEQAGQNRVEFSGDIRVRCLTGCPAIVQVTMKADDCCGNSAMPVSSTADPNDPNEIGHVVDGTEPIPRDDPRQDVVLDESAIIDPNDPTVEVRRDGFGVYRLVLREDTPARIDVVANDTDNCSCGDCAHPFDPCGSCAACSGCCATMTVHEIVTQPAHGTATIEDGEGDCNGGSVIRCAPDRGYIGPDEFTYRIRDACGNVSSVIATVYVQTIAEVAMEDVYVTACSGEPTVFTVTATDLWVDYDPAVIPFLFSIVDGPEHGIVTGDPTRVTLTPPSTVDVGGEPVPTLDFTETAQIELVYTSAVGYTGRDVITIRFEDPFGNHTTGRVDVSVIECAGEVGLADVVVRRGEILPIIAPDGFESVVETAWGAVLLIDLADGTEDSSALSVAFSEEIDRCVVYADTGSLPIGRHLLVVPLGNGETVELTIEVCAPDL